MSILILKVSIASLLCLAGSGCNAQNCSKFLRPTIGCTCVGDLLIYECSIFGPGITLWEGSGFHTGCSSIILRHSQFYTSEGAQDSCNNGRIVGKSVSIVGQCFTSQLNVTVESSLDGATVSCIHVSNGERHEIGNNTITITSNQNSLPPPTNVIVDIPNYVATRQLVFNWSSTLPASCPSAHYTIVAIDCGNCPTSATSNYTICQNAVLGHTCSFVVRSVACGVIGGPSDSISVILNVPSAPVIHSVPLYDYGTTRLQSIHTIFQESEIFEISAGIDGSAVFYTIAYINAISGDVCNSAVIPASNCVHNGICRHVFEESSSRCTRFSDVNITVFGTNLLGNGTMSNILFIEFFNQNVQIKFDLLTLNVICTFLSPNRSQKECSIIYGPGNHHSDCMNLPLTERSENNNRTGLSSVVIKLSEFPQHRSLQNQLCFIVTASDEVTTVQVAGTFNGGCDPRQLSDGTHAHAPVPVPSPDNTRCGAPLRSISIMNGIVCYTGVDTESTAFYSCSNCNSGDIISVRTCQLNGTWNGTALQCECATQSSTQPLGFMVSLSIVALGLVITSVVLIFLIVVIVFLIRAKAKLQQRLQQASLYDEIGLPPSIIDSSKNVAYSSTIGHGTSM